MSAWLSVIGIGADGVAGLGETARKLIARATLLVGGDRHLAQIPPDGRPRLRWRSPLIDTLPAIAVHRGEPVCVLATGDPFCHGIGAVLCREFDIAEMRVVPAPSAFSLACARLGWPRETVDTVSLHGRPFALVRPLLTPGNRVLCLSHDGGTAGRLAAELTACGLGDSRIQVFEHMGGADERRYAGTANAWSGFQSGPFNTVALECAGAPPAGLMARTPGLPDSAFVHDGQLTKRETRALTVALLAPAPGHLLWDIGAGCGSVAIEWLRTDARCRAIAVEKAPDRCARIAANAEALGCPGLEMREGRAPDILASCPDDPDAVFIGGGLVGPPAAPDGNAADGEAGPAPADLLSACWVRLKPGGRLVANAVTLTSEARLQHWQAVQGGSLTRLQVARAEPVGGHLGWRPLLPVTIYSITKGP